jgi:hypothetical protein
MLRAEVPPALDELVASMLTKDPAGRPPDGPAIAEALARIAEGGGLPAHQSGMRLRSVAEMPLEVTVVVVQTAAAGPAPEPDTLAPDELEPDVAAIRDLAVHFGAHVQQAGNGAFLLALAHDHPGSRATRAAELALAIAALLPHAEIAMASGAARLDEWRLAGPIVDRALRLFPAQPGVVRVDVRTAGLLSGRYPIEAGEHGLTLTGPMSIRRPAS